MKNNSSGKNILIHPTATVDGSAQIGEGTKIWHYSHVSDGSSIGESCILGQNVFIGSEVVLGKGVKVQNNVSVYTKVTLEDDVFCGPSCVFTNVYNPRAFIERKEEFLPTVVKKGATIGANATIICGVSIGKYAMIGAGAVVTEDVADYGLVVGVPARRKGWVCKCATTLKSADEGSSMKCPNCSNVYKEENNKLLVVEENA